MKKMNFILMLGVVLMSWAIVAQTVQAPVGRPPRNPAEMYALRVRDAGGLVSRPCREPSVCFANNQKSVPVSVLQSVADNISKLLSVSVTVREKSYNDLVAIQSAKRTSAHAAIIAVTEMPGLPALVVAPDSDWALVNVAALSSDDPGADKLASRVEKTMWRAFGQVMGSGWSVTPGCIMKGCSSNSKLDALRAKVIGPDVMGRIYTTVKSGKIAVAGTCTYREACQEGWAASPTNDIQRKVWNEVHQIPDKPLKIKKTK